MAVEYVPALRLLGSSSHDDWHTLAVPLQGSSQFGDRFAVFDPAAFQRRFQMAEFKLSQGNCIGFSHNPISLGDCSPISYTVAIYNHITIASSLHGYAHTLFISSLF